MTCTDSLGLLSTQQLMLALTCVNQALRDVDAQRRDLHPALRDATLTSMRDLQQLGEDLARTIMARKRAATNMDELVAASNEEGPPISYLQQIEPDPDDLIA